MKISLFPILFLLTLCACLPGVQERKFQGSLMLAPFLKENIQDMDHHEIDFQILDKDGKPVPFALLRMDWEDSGGRMSFQTDKDGILGMHFNPEMLETDVIISADVKPMGQHMMKEDDYEQSSRRLTDGIIRVTW